MEDDGDILAAYVAQALILNYDTDLDLGDVDSISHLTAFLGQAMHELLMICQALETGDATT